LIRLIVNPFYRFLLISTSLFVLWYISYELYLKEHTLLDEWVIDSLVGLSGAVLRFFGYMLISYPELPWRNQLGVEGSSGVIVGDACDGLVLFALFIIFILAYPGRWKNKLWFIPAGVLLIHFLNVLRICALTIIVSWNQSWLSFNHDYTFTILVYSVVFALWWVWVNRFSLPNTRSPEE
jgi:exosortase family protein XrtF